MVLIFQEEFSISHLSLSPPIYAYPHTVVFIIICKLSKAFILFFWSRLSVSIPSKTLFLDFYNFIRIQI